MASSICVGTTFSENANRKVCFWYLTKGRGKAGEPWTFPPMVLHPTESNKHTICTGTILWWRAVWIALLSFRVQWAPFAAKGVGKTRTSTFWQNHQFTSHLCGGTFCRKWDARHMTTLTPPNTVPLYGFNGRAQKIRLEFQSVAASVSKLPNESIEGVFLHKSRSQKTVAVSASLQTFVYELFTVQ